MWNKFILPLFLHLRSGRQDGRRQEVCISILINSSWCNHVGCWKMPLPVTALSYLKTTDKILLGSVLFSDLCTR